jgi:signal transduction histidine kinase
VKHEKDKRINAGVISFYQYFLVWLFINCVLVGYYVLLQQGIGDALPFYALIIRHFLMSVLTITAILEVARRFFYGKPIQRIAKAARQVASGDFNVRIESFRKDGKKSEIDVLVEDFNTMAKELASIETLKNDFIANVSHELKSPLAVIQTYTTALKESGISSEQRDEYIDTITNATHKLSVMITNILKLNKLENQEILPMTEPFQLGEQLRRCALQFMEQWQSKDINFNIDVEDVLVSYDESLLEIVWNNLISNAVKFSEPNGKIELTSKKENGFVVVKVRDTGHGMTEDVKAHIFDKFYQGDSSHSTEGNGLGLALTKKVIQIINGEITVKTELGMGSVFEVKLKV